MPPKKRITKAAAAAAAAATEADEAVVVQTETPQAVADTTDYTATTKDDTGSGPVVLQLTIPLDRMNEIVDAMSTQEPSNVDPEPYAPVEPYMLSSAPTDTPSTAGAHSMVCFWCCHSIVDKEYGMPIRYDSVHNSFTMFGCFCSLECTAAHNFSLHMGSDRAWEIHSWIQLLARRYGFSGKVRPAPSRYLLKMFNGPLTIEEFRNAHKDLSRTYIMNIPPFIHVSSQMEQLNTSFMAAGASVGGLPHKSCQKGT
jgi:hypothetical protein